MTFDIMQTNFAQVADDLEKRLRGRNPDELDFHETFRDVDDELYAYLLSKRYPGRNLLKGVLPDYPSEEINADCTGTSSIQQTIMESLYFWTMVKNVYARLGRKLLWASRIADYGAGWGRITRFFGKDVRRNSLFAIEPNPAFREIYRHTRVPGTVLPISFMSEEPSEVDDIDLLISFSIFTHASDRLARNIRDRWSEMMADGGIVIFTIRPGSFLDLHPAGEMSTFTDPELASAKTRYARGELVYKPYDASPDWGVSLMPMRHLEQLFGATFEMIRPHFFYFNQTQLPIAMRRRRR